MTLIERQRRLARGGARPGDRLLVACLAPLAALYGLGAALRNRAYDAGLLHSRQAGAFTLGIGSLSAGGTGKTPLAAHLAGWLQQWGCRPLLVTGGYGALRPLGRPHLVTAGGPAGGQVPAGWETVGEEALLLARLAPGIPVAAARRREESLAVARAAGLDPRVLVLDGAFQHRRLVMDFLLATVDGSRSPGRGHLLPWGDLREPWACLRRADFLILHRAERCPSPAEWEQFLAHHAPGAGLARVENRWGKPYLMNGGGELDWQALASLRLGVWLGLADPRPFLDELARRGVTPAWAECPRDHAPFGAETAARLAGRARALDGLLVSEKDAVKIEAHARALPPVYVIPAEIVWLSGRALLECRLREALARAACLPEGGRGGGVSTKPGSETE